MLPSHFVDTVTETSHVPCNGCTLCCRSLIVPLAEEEYQNYLWAWVKDARSGEVLGKALQRRPNGECVYLGEKGCTIHEDAPHVCKRFSCAEMFQKSDRAGRRQSIKSGKLPKPLWDKGREMAKSMGLVK